MEQFSKKSFTLSASEFLETELMVDKNKQFVLNEFEVMADLEIQEMYGWKAVAHRHFTKRPIGNKPYITEDLLIPVSQFSQVLLQNDLYKFDLIEIDDTFGRHYAKKITEYAGYGANDFAIFFTIKDMYIEHIWVELVEYENRSITKICKALHAIGHIYQMILVDWYLKLKVDLSNYQEIIRYLETLEEEYKDV